jgi:hypothetical protein
MWKFVANAKQILWEAVELGFLLVLTLLLLHLLLGPNGGPYLAQVADNVTKFAAQASAGMIGILVVLGILFLILRRRIG